MLTGRMTTLGFVVILLATMSGTQLNAQNWPQWRGDSLDNLSPAKGLPAEFDAETNLLWKVELPGPGGASPVIWEDKVFVISVVSETNELRLICFRNTGEVIWSRPLKGKSQFIRIDSANSASPSPSTDGNRVWATTGQGHLECFDMDGKPLWAVDLQERYGKFQIQFGMTSTPIHDQGRLYLQLIHGSMREPGTSVGHVVAIDGESGDEIWHQVRETDGIAENRHSYASPCLVRDGDAEYLVTHGGDFVIGHSLEDGREIWRCGGMNPKSRYNKYLRFVASPTYIDGRLLVPSAKNGPVLCLKTDLEGEVTEDESKRHWTLERGTPDVACPVFYDGLVYLARENGVMLCLDGETGERVYQKRMMDDRHRSTPVVADGKIFVAGRKGTVVVLEPGREGNVLAENDLGEETTASPAIVDGRIYIRTWNALYCFGEK